ncbi:MAG: hypothetical protein ABL921_26555, partial [Pirellula sp.]
MIIATNKYYHRHPQVRTTASAISMWIAIAMFANSQDRESDSESQRISSLAQRLVEAMESLGSALSEEVQSKLREARSSENASEVESLLDRLAVARVIINPESRVKVEAGAASPTLQQSGYVPWIIKIENQGAVKSPIQVHSPQAGPSYSGVALLSMQRQDQLELRNNEAKPDSPRRFLHFEWFAQPPMSSVPSGAKTEYAILLVYSSESGKREATLEFSVGSGTQDLGFRAQMPVLLDVRPAVPVALDIRDDEGAAAFARLTIRDKQGHVYPPQPRRLAPDLFFQQQIYRENGESVLLPPGEFIVEYTQGPESI